MSSHADCTHPSTKAARAACRAGRPMPPAGEAPTKARRLIDPDKLTHMQRVDPITGEPIGPEIPLSRPAAKHPYMSGHCANGFHDRCAGVYAGTACTCDCDHAQ